jgi:crotonobetainyl-CoA:carnitine CoA-transferase CaiB-like acyl-CoA transferase
VAPDLGQHNGEVAAKLGFSEAEIKSMQSERVLFSA